MTAMYWPLWLLAHYPERSWQKQPTAAAAAAAASPAFMNGVPFPLMEEGFWFSKWTWQVIVCCVYWSSFPPTQVSSMLFSSSCSLSFYNWGAQYNLTLWWYLTSDLLLALHLPKCYLLLVEFVFYFSVWNINWLSENSKKSIFWKLVSGDIILYPGRSVCGQAEECV